MPFAVLPKCLLTLVVLPAMDLIPILISYMKKQAQGNSLP